MKLTDVTPRGFLCGIGSCPAVLETDRGTFLVIGRTVEAALLSEIAGRLGVAETVIEVPKALLADLARRDCSVRE